MNYSVVSYIIYCGDGMDVIDKYILKAKRRSAFQLITDIAVFSTGYILYRLWTEKMIQYDIFTYGIIFVPFLRILYQLYMIFIVMKCPICGVSLGNTTEIKYFWSVTGICPHCNTILDRNKLNSINK